MDAVGLVAEFLDPVAGALADRLRQIGRPVIAVIARHNVGLARMTGRVLIIADHPHGRINRGRSARGKVHAVQIARGKFGKFGRKPGRGIIGHVDKGVGKGQLFDLFGDGRGHFLAP